MDDAGIKALLESTKLIALVGASNRAERDSNQVMAYLQRCGYRVIPVNPGLVGTHIHSEPVVASLAEITRTIDLVDIFRNSDAAGQVVDEAIAAGAKAVWMQLGVINASAAARAADAGLNVVMDRCPKIEIPRLGMSLA